MDENNVNDIWLETQYEEFQDAMDEGKVFAAKAVIQKLKENGFDRQADELSKELLAYKPTV